MMFVLILLEADTFIEKRGDKKGLVRPPVAQLFHLIFSLLKTSRGQKWEINP